MKFNTNFSLFGFVVVNLLFENKSLAKPHPKREVYEGKQRGLAFVPEEKIIGGEETAYGRYPSPIKQDCLILIFPCFVEAH